MELLKANKTASSTVNADRIYEFLGRYQKVTEAIDEAGQPTKIIEKGQQKYLLVVADTLYDAVVYIHTCRPAFIPEKVRHLS